MVTSRSDIFRGPATVEFNGARFYSKEDIQVEMSEETMMIATSNWGDTDERPISIMHKLSIMLDGRWLDLSTLFPYATALIGSSVFGADKTLTIHTVGGRKRVYKSAAVMKMPNAGLSSVKTLFSAAVEFTCLHAIASAWGDANSLFTDSTEAYPGDADYEISDIITQPYVLNWIAAKAFSAADTDLCTASGHRFHNGMRVRLTTTNTLPAPLELATTYFVIAANRTAGTFKLSATFGGAAVNIADTGTGTHTITPYVWSSFGTVDGVSVEFNLSLEPLSNDDKGVYDYTFQKLDVTATLQPEVTGLLPQDITSARMHQGPGAARGRSLSEAGSNLIVSAPGVYFLLNQAVLKNSKEAYGASARHIGPAQWKATRTFTAGEPDPLFYVGTEAPA